MLLHLVCVCVYYAGRKLLETVLSSVHLHPNVARIYLHVQTSNEEAITLYRKFGFDISETIKDYYKRISPPDCYVLSKDIIAAAAEAVAAEGTPAVPAEATAAVPVE